MAMTETAGQLDLEPRWPIILTIIVVFALTLLPGRVRAFPPWARVLVVVVLIAPMAGLWLSPAKQRWLRIESIVTVASVLIAGAGMILDLKDLFVRMVTPPTGITGIQLLNSSIALWFSNMLIFSVLSCRVNQAALLPVLRELPAHPIGSSLVKRPTTNCCPHGGPLSWTICS